MPQPIWRSKEAVKWRCASVFAAAGVIGAFAGSSLSKMVEGQELLALFALLMLVVAGLMFVRRSVAVDADVRLGRENLPKLLALALAPARSPVSLASVAAF